MGYASKARNPNIFVSSSSTQLWKQHGIGIREGRQLDLKRYSVFYSYFFFSEILVYSAQFIFIKHPLHARYWFKCHGGNIVVTIKGSKTLLMETCINKLSVSCSVINDGQRYIQNLGWMREPVQVTTLVTLETSRQPSEGRHTCIVVWMTEKFQSGEMGEICLLEDGKVGWNV